MERLLLLLLASTAWGSQCSWDPKEAALECRLRPLDEAEATMTLVLAKHQTQATRQLKVQCQAMEPLGQPLRSKRQRLRVDYKGSPAASSGGNRGGQAWPHLQSLQVEHCPLATIGVVLDGLSYEQTSASSDVLSHVIQPLLGGRPLSGLRHLSLVNVSADLNSGLWCEIVSSNLVSLNLSSNGLDRLPLAASEAASGGSLGLGEGCKPMSSHLEVLNLSNNAISRLVIEATDPWFPLASASLTHLDVSRNRLQAIRLAKMQRLVVLDVSDNKLSSSKELMEAVKASASTLQELHAQGNQMEWLPNLATAKSKMNTVVHFDNLLVLNLSRNALKEAAEGPHFVLSGLRSLVALDLSHNKLTKVDDHLFSDLIHLQVLSLSHNQIVQLEPQSMASLTRLHVLVLSHNNLDEKGLPSDLLHRMSDLRSLSLDHNRLKSLPR